MKLVNPTDVLSTKNIYVVIPAREKSHTFGVVFIVAANNIVVRTPPYNNIIMTIDGKKSFTSMMCLRDAVASDKMLMYVVDKNELLTMYESMRVSLPGGKNAV